MNAPEDALAEILAEHVLHDDEDDGVCMVLGGSEPCPHGWTMPADAYEDGFGEERAHLAHVAQVLAEWVAGEKARAWDEALRPLARVALRCYPNGLMSTATVIADIEESRRRNPYLTFGREDTP